MHLSNAQAMYKSAEVRAKALAQAVEEQGAEAGRLDLRLAAALDQWETGKSKVQATARQLQSLHRQVPPPLVPRYCKPQSLHRQVPPLLVSRCCLL